MSKRFIITVITLIVIGVGAAVAIFLAKGYTISPQEKRIVGTGIITVSSEPDAASVYIDGHLTTATNATISSLTPKIYSVKVIKEGFIPWEKKLEVKEGLVTEVKVTLFPAIPTIYPLTFTGVSKPVLSPDGSKLAYIVPTQTQSGEPNKKGGVWVWTLIGNQPIAFARSAEPHQIASSSLADFSQADLQWSADSKQVLATVGKNNYLLESDRLNNEPRDITPILQATLDSWKEDIQAKDEARILAIQDLGLRKIASDSAQLYWSPDETKMMVKKEPTSALYVYDLESKKEYPLPDARAHLWLPDSRHIILVEEETISLIDFDGTNKAIIFAGKFEDSFVFPWPDSSRLVIISSLPTPTASEPNLYGINLR
ncbi:PEGA domain-containing protein [Candidatus Microgenomates bacterium]|nr:PEGA domain-containing protein [Candidatus Microgenomates bacterium]